MYILEVHPASASPVRLTSVFQFPLKGLWRPALGMAGIGLFARMLDETGLKRDLEENAM